MQRGNAFMRQFFSRAGFDKGLYLLRSMFLQMVKRACSAEITREQASMELAAKAAGHKGTKVTGTHYVPRERGIPLLTMEDLANF